MGRGLGSLTRVLGRAAVVGAALALLAASPSSQERAAGASVVDVVLEARRAEATRERLRDELRGLGREALPALIETLAGAAPEAPALTPDEREALRLAALAWGRDGLAGASRSLLLAGAPAPVRETLLDLLEEVAEPRDLGLAIEVASLPEAPHLGVSLGRVTRGLLEGGLRSHAELPRRILGASDPLRPFLYQALEALPARPRGRVLGETLLHERQHAPLVLERFSATMLASSEEPRGAVTTHLETRLVLAEEDELRYVARAVGVLELVDAVPRLVELLRADDPGVRGEAVDALRRITGQSFGPEHALWSGWYVREIEWRDEHLADTLAALDGDDPVAVFRAVRELCRHRLFRHELTMRLVDLLQHEDTRICEIACASLAQLGSSRAVEPLLQSLEDDPEESVRLSAWRALRSLTRLDLPPAADAWRDALANEE